MKIAINWLQNFKWFSKAKNKKVDLPTIFPDRYKIIEKIGDGATSDIFLAIQKSTREHVALKAPKPFLYYSEYENVIEQFRNEARFLQSYKHVNIIKASEVQLAEKPYFMALEFIEGGNMLDIMKKRRNVFSFIEIIKYLKPLCNALDFLHNQGFVYCDFKPMNVMIDKERICVLTDFGSIRTYSVKQKFIAVRGTPEYMAPELWEQDSDISPSTDIYAIGIWLYQMLTGCNPLTGTKREQVGNIQEIMILHHSQQPIPASRLRRGLNQKIDNVLNKCLEKNMNNRYQNISDLMNDLRLAIG